MGFLERSRSLRRKDSAVPLQKKEQSSPSTRVTRDVVTPSNPQDAGRPSTTGQAGTSKQLVQRDSSRPRTASRVTDKEQQRQPPMPYHTFKFPTPSDSPRASASSHSRSLTLNDNGSSSALHSATARKAPGYKRSFTSPAHVPQASIYHGTVKLSTKELPALEPSPPLPPTPKQPILHKAKSSTWRSFFSRKQSKTPTPATPAFDASELPSLSGKGVPALAAERGVEHQHAPPAPPKNAHVRGQSRGMTRQAIRAELDKAQFIKDASSPAPRSAGPSIQHGLRPSAGRSVTEGSMVVSGQYLDAASRCVSAASRTSRSTREDGGPSTPRLEISIPNMELDRYSVMFEKLLKPKQSLAERRKTAIQGLSLPGEAVESDKVRRWAIFEHEKQSMLTAIQLSASLDTPGRPQRRATSPNLQCPTPLTADFQESSSQIATPVAMQRVSAVAPRILRRSHTAPPGAMNAPLAEPYIKDVQQQQAGDNTYSACSTHNSPMWSEASLPATPDTTSDDTEMVGSPLGYDDDDEKAEIVVCEAKPIKPTLRITTTRTPTTETAPPIPPKAPGRSYSSELLGQHERRIQHPPRTSSLDSCHGDAAHSPQPPGQGQSKSHPNPLQMHRVRQPVQISMARQVSVRRPSGTHRESSSSKQQVPTIVAPTAVFSKQPLRPRVVEVRNRKSTIVVFEDASSSASVSRESLVPMPTPRESLMPGHE